MKIGLMNHSRNDLLEEIAWIGKHGFDFVGLTLAPPAADPHRLDAIKVNESLGQHRLGVVVQTPALIPLGSPLRGIRQAALEELRCCLAVAQQIFRPIPAFAQTPMRFAAGIACGKKDPPMATSPRLMNPKRNRSNDQHYQ